MKSFIPLILFTVLTNFFSQILLKKGMTEFSDVSFDSAQIAGFAWAVATNIYVIAGLFVMVVSMASHLVVLSKVDISFAYPFLGLSFVLITLYGHFALQEPLNSWKIMGVIFIVAGVSMVARS